MKTTEETRAEMSSAIQHLERQIRYLCVQLSRDVTFNPRCVAIGRTSLQQGLLWLKQSFVENDEPFVHPPSDT